MSLSIPDFALVVLIGASGAGKSTFARRHFRPTEVVSSDHCRGVVDDDETSQKATPDAFTLVHAIVDLRLKRRKFAVVDATNVRSEDRAPLVALAKQHHAIAVAIVLDPGEAVCHQRNATRADRAFGAHVVRNQTSHLRRGLHGLEREGFRVVHILRGDAIDAATIVRTPAMSDRRDLQGPFDIIGDVHGCADELERLLETIGYAVRWADGAGERSVRVVPPPGRRAVFVGDLVDRGPRTPDVLRIVMALCETGGGFCVPGNHDDKLLRWLKGRNVQPAHGLAETITQFDGQPASFRQRTREFLDTLVSHLWLDGGRLVVAHAGIPAHMIGRTSGAVRAFCLYGDTTGEMDAFGLPVRRNWAATYAGEAAIVYGHTPMAAPVWLNNTINIDTGCCFGGGLTALRWPEREVVTVPAIRPYAVPRRPLGGGAGDTRP
jgi:protein phosphatase